MSLINNQEGESRTSGLCPVTGLPILQKPEWTDMGYGKDYKLTVRIVGSSILHSRPSGYATIHDTEHALKLTGKVVAEAISEDLPYVQIEDYSNLHGASFEARRYFIDNMQKRERLIALIFCGATPFFKMSIKLGKRFTIVKRNVQLVEDYSEAVKLALEILSAEKNLAGDSVEHIPTQPLVSPPKLTTRDDGHLQLDGYTVRYELIDDDIAHSISTGFLEEAHIPPLFEIIDKGYNQMRLHGRPFYFINGVKELKGVTLKARKLYIDNIIKWYENHPFHIIIFYGANRLFHAAVNLAKPFLPFRVRVVKDLDSALKMISDKKSESKKSLPHPKTAVISKPSPKPDQTGQYLDELLHFIGNINWEADGLDDNLPEKESSHPLGPVFDAISLIKMDVDQLFQERKRAEDALIESEGKYRTILQSIEDGYYEVDIKGNFTFFNDSMCKILGYTRDELLGMNNRRYTDKENAKKVFKTFNLVYRTGEPSKALDWGLIKKDGSRCSIETSISLIKDSKGESVGFRGVARDVTERRLAEKEKKRLETQLQQAKKMEAIGTLAGGVAHDLNNILSGIVSYPELLLMDLPEESPLRRPLLTIQESGERAATIVQDLLTLARRGVAVMEVVNLNETISDYLRSPEHEKLRSFHPNVRFETNLETDTLNISGSSVHLSKTVMNLASNAAESMPEGGKVLISTENRYIDRPIKGYNDVDEGDYVILFVSDTGVGISSEDVERIFEPFYTKKVMGRSGTGLGMAVVWGTVKDHKGYIDVESVEGKGTTFKLIFPATRKEIARDEPTLSIDDYMGKGESILVIDDVKEQREITSGMLKRLGYSVTSVSSGEEAIDYLKNNSADLLVLDMIMDPGIDGLDTYRQILKLHPGQKAIIASGYSETERVKEAQRLGAGLYLKKPYTLEKMGIAVKTEFERW